MVSISIGLRARWRERVPKAGTPDHLSLASAVIRSSPIGFKPIASGDLDHETIGNFWIVPGRWNAVRQCRRGWSASIRSWTELKPGTVLVREWDRRSQRVMVMSDGFAWNGPTYDSLSKVAFAITGTKWNGPRFFGLRDKEDRSATEALS